MLLTQLEKVMTLDEFKSIDEEMMNSNLHLRKKIYESLLLDQRQLCADSLCESSITPQHVYMPNAITAILNATGESK